MTRRTERLSSLLRQEISELLRSQVNDPRLSSLISVTKVLVSPDLRQAKVLVSVLGTEAQKNEVLSGFTAASGFLRWKLAQRLTLRRIPELSFGADDSIEQGAKVLKLINQLTDVSRGENEH